VDRGVQCEGVLRMVEAAREREKEGRENEVVEEL